MRDYLSYGIEPSAELKAKAEKYKKLSEQYRKRSWLSQLFKVLSNPTRLQILEFLTETKVKK